MKKKHMKLRIKILNAMVKNAADQVDLLCAQLGRRSDTIDWYYDIIQQRNDDLELAEERIRYLEGRVDRFLAHADAFNRQFRSVGKDVHEKAQRIAFLENQLYECNRIREEQLRLRKVAERKLDLIAWGPWPAPECTPPFDSCQCGLCEKLREEETKLSTHCGDV
jgi:hypothetical protein